MSNIMPNAESKLAIKDMCATESQPLLAPYFRLSSTSDSVMLSPMTNAFRSFSSFSDKPVFCVELISSCWNEVSRRVPELG
jgi:hypothetical protein